MNNKRKCLSKCLHEKLESLMKIVGQLFEKFEMINTRILLFEKQEDKDGWVENQEFLEKT
jgi:hypothetical protein